jgi:hypothetical protein
MEPGKNRIVVPARQVTQPGGIGSLELILGLLESLKIRARAVCYRKVRGSFFPLGTKNSIVGIQRMIDFISKNYFHLKEKKREQGDFYILNFIFHVCMFTL